MNSSASTTQRNEGEHIVIRAQRWIAFMGLVCIAAATSAVVAASAEAESAWVARDLKLHLRTGPGLDYRPVGSVENDDGVTILKRTEKWTQVRLPDGQDGWIPAGYLKAEAPPTVRLGQLEGEVVELRGQLETVTAERETLSSSNSDLSSNDETQSVRIAELTHENMRLTAGQRWPEWITGGVMVCVGMALGAVWSRSSGRRSTPRIRL